MKRYAVASVVLLVCVLVKMVCSNRVLNPEKPLPPEPQRGFQVQKSKRDYEPRIASATISRPQNGAIEYGREFWRRNQSGKGSIDFADVIERVSYAIGSDGGIEGNTYRASYGDDALNFSPHRLIGTYPQPDSQAELVFRTTQVSAGSDVLFAGETSAWLIHGNTAQRPLGARGIIEHHELRSTGIEVCWIIEERPLASAEVRVEAECRGMNFVGRTEHGVHFADLSGTSRVRVGNARAVDSAGRSWGLQMTPGYPGFSINVPAEVLAVAEFPLAIDPLISPEFGMDNPIIVRADGDQVSPGAAFNGTQYLVAWTDKRFDAAGDIFGTRVDTNGVVLDPYGIAISTAVEAQTDPGVAATGTNFLVAWRDRRTGQPTIYGARVRSDGTLLEQHGFLVSATAVNVTPEAVAVAAGPANCLVVWRDSRNSSSTGSDIYGARVGENGNVLDPNGIAISRITGTQRNPAVAANASGYLVVWEDLRAAPADANTYIYGTLVSAGGVVANANGTVISPGPSTKVDPAVGSDGTNFLVAWEDFRDNVNDPEIYGVRVSSAGAVLDANGIAIHKKTGFQQRPAVGFNGTDYLVVWELFGIHGTRVKPSGAVVNPEGFRVSDNNSAVVPVVVSDGRDFLVAWEGGFNIKAALVDSEGVPGPFFFVNTAAHRENAPAVAGNGSQFLVVWSDLRGQFANPADIFGVRVDLQGNILDPAGLVICTATNNQTAPAVAANGEDYFVVWTDARRGVGALDVYGTRITSAGVVQNPGGLPISSAASTQSVPDVVSAGGDYLVVWEDGRAPFTPSNLRIFGSRVSASGEALDTNGFQIGFGPASQTAPSVAGRGNDYFVAWADARTSANGLDIYGARVSGAGRVLDTNAVPISQGRNAQQFPEVAASSNDFLVVWADLRNNDASATPTNSDIYATRVRVDGSVINPNGIAISTAAGNQARPEVASNGRDFFAVWADERLAGVDAGPSDVFGARVSPTGAVLDASGLAINTNRWNQLVPALGFANGMFLVACQGTRDGSVRTVGNIVNLNTIPIAYPQIVSIAEDEPFSLILHGTDGDGDPLAFTVISDPGHGILSGTPPTVIYTPASNYFGSDSFMFRVSDGTAQSAVALVTINVTGVNDAPVATARVIDPISLPGVTNRIFVSPNNNNAVVVLDASLSSDIENDPLEFAWFTAGNTESFATGTRTTNAFALGTHTIVLRVSDGAATATQEIEFEVVGGGAAVGALVLYLEETNVDRRNKRPFISTLKAVMNSFEDGHFHSGVQQLNALQNKVRAQLLPAYPDAAATLTGAAQAIIDAMSTAGE
jgi:hypothetical protein